MEMDGGAQRQALSGATEGKFTRAIAPAPAAIAYTVSARRKDPNLPVFAFLRNEYRDLPLGQIESLFGFVEYSALYGGRDFVRPELSDRDVYELAISGIGIRLPMSNHYADLDEYKKNKPLLKKYHRQPNSIIVTNDDLAKWIREDFPDYHIDASVIKNIKTLRKIEAALELYDSVVLPMRLNEDLDFLEKIEAKEKIILFANAGCALSCPSKLCYQSISKLNRGEGGEVQCSQNFKGRELRGMVDFPLQTYMDLGFHRFKLLRAQPGGTAGY